MPGSGFLKKTSHGRWSHSVEYLRNEAKKSIWFAFQTLIDPKNAMVQTQPLKDLTSKIGNALGIEKCEELHKEIDLIELDFSSYFTLIEFYMFDKLSKASLETMNLSNIDYQNVHSVCWMLFYKHEKGKTIPEDIPENVAFKLWIMFILFSEEDDSDSPIFPLNLDPEEATVIFDAILSQTGNKDVLTKATDAMYDESMTYQKYLEIFFIYIYKHVKEGVIESAVETAYDQIVFDILKKGNMVKCGNKVKSWKERWMVLTPTDLKYYVSADKKQIKGTIAFENTYNVELLSDKAGKQNMFVLKTPQRAYEMSALDTKSRNEWVTGIQIAINHADDPNYHYHKDLSKQRRHKRNLLRKENQEDRWKRRERELLRQMKDEYKQKELMNEETLRQKLRELDETNKAKANLEALLREQRERLEEERRRVLELEASKAKLEKLLEMERQAKKDEKTDRRLQAKLLEEESEKKEERERLKKEKLSPMESDRVETKKLRRVPCCIFL